MAANTSQVNGCFDTRITATDDCYVLILIERTIAMRAEMLAMTNIFILIR